MHCTIHTNFNSNTVERHLLFLPWCFFLIFMNKRQHEYVSLTKAISSLLIFFLKSLTYSHTNKSIFDIKNLLFSIDQLTKDYMVVTIYLFFLSLIHGQNKWRSDSFLFFCLFILHIERKWEAPQCLPWWRDNKKLYFISLINDIK